MLNYKMLTSKLNYSEGKIYGKFNKAIYIYSVESFEEKCACTCIGCVTSFKREYRIIPILSWVVKL